MNHAFQITHLDEPKVEAIVIKQQLAREINCLEGQLARIVNRDDTIDRSTIKTYQDMIESRRKVLQSLIRDGS